MSGVFDRIFASAPLDKTAGSVVSAGESYTPDFKSPRRFWETPPALKRVPDRCQDFAGVTFGRLRVLGLLNEIRQHNAAWVVRCVCGIYETRTARAIRKADPEAKCQFCEHTARLRYRGSQQRSVEDFLAEARGSE